MFVAPIFCQVPSSQWRFDEEDGRTRPVKWEQYPTVPAARITRRYKAEVEKVGVRFVHVFSGSVQHRTFKLQTWSFNGYVYVIMFAYFPHCAALVCLASSETIADNLIMCMLCVWSQCLEMSSRKENDFRDTFGSRLRADHVRKSDLCAVLRQEIQRCWSETTKLWHFYIWVHGKLTAWLNAVHAQPSPTVISGQRSRKGSKISDSFKFQNWEPQWPRSHQQQALHFLFSQSLLSMSS